MTRPSTRQTATAPARRPPEVERGYLTHPAPRAGPGAFGTAREAPNCGKAASSRSRRAGLTSLLNRLSSGRPLGPRPANARKRVYSMPRTAEYPEIGLPTLPYSATYPPFMTRTAAPSCCPPAWRMRS
jgi:hypothetical protein